MSSDSDDTDTSTDVAPVERRTFVQGIGVLPLSTTLFDDEAEPQTARSQNRPNDGRTRRFTVHAVEVDIFYNQYGLHQPNGVMYVLEENLDAVRAASGVAPDDGFSLVDDETATTQTDSNAGQGRGQGPPDDDEDEVDTSVIEPLVIRANEGGTIQIRFVNHLDRHASMHQTALPYDVQTSDGMAVGLNPDTTAPPGETVQYRWEATHTGTHFFYDGANQAVDSADEPPQEANLLSRGLFGAIVVEPEGATWTDPETGGELRSGTRAVIDDPNGLGTTYREFVPFYHTPEGMEPEVFWPDSDVPQTVHAINYRADPLGQRDDEFYNSWTNGDPGGGDNVFETYKGDPVKYTFVGASLEENHVHHLHQHRWKEVPRTASDTIDAQTIGLGTRSTRTSSPVTAPGHFARAPVSRTRSRSVRATSTSRRATSSSTVTCSPTTPRGCGQSCASTTRCNPTWCRSRTPVASSDRTTTRRGTRSSSPTLSARRTTSTRTRAPSAICPRNRRSRR
ncbi:multicopper oxidase domain-containing protein [Haloarcula sp. JP-L23]|uniref:multicopper oxidase domain-containing protein n=1 Tax=Haloarcula sp. JP-L23 TaxID=2716717 RepID=UPI001D054813